MINTFICPECKKEIELSAALQHELEEKALVSERKKHQDEIEKMKKQVEEKAKLLAVQQFEAQLKNSQEEISEAKTQNKKLMEDLAELLKEKRELKRKDEERELEMQKKLSEIEEKARQEALEKADKEHHLKDLEKDKKMQDLGMQIEELKRKLQQGSQQTQGEVLELELEDMLREAFPEDEIAEVGKGIRGADVVETVVNKYGQKCGTILWELKNAKWSEGWIDKLNEDKRQVNANIAVLVSVNLPESIKQFGYYKGVWVTCQDCVVGLAWSLRMNLGQVHSARQIADGKKEKAGIMYDYITGVEFKNRVEGIMEAYQGLLDELEKEKRWFGMKWAREEKEIRRVLDNTYGMYGDLQGISGRSMPEIKNLTLPDEQLKLG